jgi:hypothetical protein
MGAQGALGRARANAELLDQTDSGDKKNHDRRNTPMITEPKIEHRNEQPYVGIRAQVTMQELGKVLPPLWVKVMAGWQAKA